MHVHNVIRNTKTWGIY